MMRPRPLGGRLRGRNLLTDCPQEGSELAGNRRCRNRALLPIGNEPTVAGAQPDLCLPGDAANAEGEILEPTPQGLAHPCRKPVSPRSLDQHPSCSMIAGLGNGAAPHRIPGRAFRRNQAEKSHQLLRGRKATYIANLRNEGDRDKERYAPQGLVGCHYRRHCPGRHDLAHLLLQSSQANLCCVDHLNMILENDLLRRMIEGLLRQPALMHLRPILPTWEVPIMAED